MPAVRDATPVIGVPELRFQKCRNIRLPTDLADLPHVCLEDCGAVERRGSGSTSADHLRRSDSDSLVARSDSVDSFGGVTFGVDGKAAVFAPLAVTSDGTHLENVNDASSSSSSHDGVVNDAHLLADTKRAAATMGDTESSNMPACSLDADGRLRVRANADDWVVEARRLQQTRDEREAAEKAILAAKLDEIAREKRLREFEAIEAERLEREVRLLTTFTHCVLITLLLRARGLAGAHYVSL